eukprot:RCo018118
MVGVVAVMGLFVVMVMVMVAAAPEKPEASFRALEERAPEGGRLGLSPAAVLGVALLAVPWSGRGWSSRKPGMPAGSCGGFEGDWRGGAGVLRRRGARWGQPGIVLGSWGDYRAWAVAVLPVAVEVEVVPPRLQLGLRLVVLFAAKGSQRSLLRSVLYAILTAPPHILFGGELFVTPSSRNMSRWGRNPGVRAGQLILIHWPQRLRTQLAGTWGVAEHCNTRRQKKKSRKN